MRDNLEATLAKRRDPQPAWVLGDFIPRLAISALILIGITIAYFEVQAENAVVNALRENGHPVTAEVYATSMEEVYNPDLELNESQKVYYAHVRFVAPSHSVIEGKVPVDETAVGHWKDATPQSPGKIRLITNTAGTSYLEAVDVEGVGGVTDALKQVMLALLIPAAAYFLFTVWRLYRAIRKSRKSPQPAAT